MYILIDPIEGVVVKNPNFSLKQIELLMKKRALWIYKKLALMSHKKCISKIYENEKKILIYGEKKSLSFDGKLANFYKEKTVDVVPQLVEKWSKKMGLNPTKISFRKTKKRWGSCSFRDELSFTSSLVQLPMRCIEYIVVHELSHIRHKHHKRDFWIHVAKFMPDFKECETILKEYSPQI